MTRRSLIALFAYLLAAGLPAQGATQSRRRRRSAPPLALVSQPESETVSELDEMRASQGLGSMDCGADAPDISFDHLEQALALGRSFLIRSQTADGNFRYEYNFATQEESDDDSSVRQAGTLWSLTQLYADEPTPDLLQAIRRGLQFFDKYSEDMKHDRRLIRYPGEKGTKLGTIALIALCHIELLRFPGDLTHADQEELRNHLAGYVKTLLRAESKAHLFHKMYSENGKPEKKASPYYDGESLLALVKIAKYFGREDLWDRISEMADAGWNRHCEPGFAKGSSKKQTKELKSYYQWAMMSWYEMLSSGKRQRFERFGERLLQMAMFHLKRQKPGHHLQGSVLEGIFPAYIVAVDTERRRRIACALRKEVHFLLGNQVGHPLARGLAKQAHEREDIRALGGVMFHDTEPLLRIDATQHQTHAMLQAKRLMRNKGLL